MVGRSVCKFNEKFDVVGRGGGNLYFVAFRMIMIHYNMDPLFINNHPVAEAIGLYRSCSIQQLKETTSHFLEKRKPLFSFTPLAGEALNAEGEGGKGQTKAGGEKGGEG